MIGKKEVGVKKDNSPGGSPGYLPKPPMMCCALDNRNLRFALKSSRWTF